MQENSACKGSLEKLKRGEDYVESLKKLASIIQRIDLKKVFVDGDDVCVLYDMVTNTPAGTAFIAEWYQVKGGKIAALRVVFDARPFAALFGRLSSGRSFYPMTRNCLNIHTMVLLF